MKFNFGSLGDFFVKHFVCCIPEDIVEDMEDDLEVKQRVHEAMLTVDVSGASEQTEALAALNPRPMLVCNLETRTLEVQEHVRPAAYQPKFVVQVVLALRCKLGLGAKDRRVPGNVELVRREAAKIMRSWNVRDADISLHLRYVERCFFEDNTHDRVPEWRMRAAHRGRLYRWLFKDEQPQYDF